MKLWIDDVRPAPDEKYIWCKTVNEAKEIISNIQEQYATGRNWNAPDIKLINIDHDAGDYASEGGDYIRLLDWLEEKHLSYPIHIHSMNPVGVANMRAIIERNGWTEVK